MDFAGQYLQCNIVNHSTEEKGRREGVRRGGMEEKEEEGEGTILSQTAM